MPQVSVVIPCFNYARYLSECVQSALDQPGVSVDVTVIDDASTDVSHAVAEEIAVRDPRVRVFRHEQNQGHLATANEALRAASREFVVKLDADDLLAPGSLARSVALLTAYPSVSFVYGWPEMFQGDPPRLDEESPKSWTIWRSEEWLHEVLGRAHNVIAQPEVMIRRAALLEVGGYRPDLPWAEDYNLWLRLAMVGDVGRVNGCTQGLYRVHAKSVQRSSRDVRLSDLRGRIEATRRFTEQAGVPVDCARHALLSIAHDTRRLLAARRDEPGTPAEILDEYHQLALRLEAEIGAAALRGPLTWRGPVGKSARRAFESFRWRRWRATGV